MPPDPLDVGLRQDLATFVEALGSEYRADPKACENNDLDRFLAALPAWIDDSPGYWATAASPSRCSPIGLGWPSRCAQREATSDGRFRLFGQSRLRARGSRERGRLDHTNHRDNAGKCRITTTPVQCSLAPRRGRGLESSSPR